MNSKLLHLIKTGDTEPMALGLVRDDVQEAEAQGFFPLHYAAYKGNAEALKRLLLLGADVNLRAGTGAFAFFQEPVPVAGETALHFAACYGHTDCAYALLQAGADKEALDGNGQTALNWGARNGFYRRLKDVFGHGRNYAGLEAMRQAARTGQRPLFKELYSKEDWIAKEENPQAYPLEYLALVIDIHESILEGNVNQIQRLLKQDGSLVNARWTGLGFYPLEQASGNREIYELLLNHGAQENEELVRSEMAAAAYNGDMEWAEYLYAKGRPVDSLNTLGLPPLYYAVARGKLQMVEFLLTRGANPNFQPFHATSNVWSTIPPTCGETALHLATFYGFGEIIEVLLSSGSDCDLKDNSAQKTRDWAVRGGRLNKEVMRKL